jgi:polyhydroxybutyrate depolymerase
MPVLACNLLLVALAGPPLGPGDHERSIRMGDTVRTYLVHVPPQYDPRRPMPLVLALHGAWTDAQIHVRFCGLSGKADKAGFIAVYPNGTGIGQLLFWNSGMVRFPAGQGQPDDVAFIAKTLDDLETVLNVDRRRVYATGMSNGGMMCYRLAAELSERIAAIGVVGGTLSLDKVAPKRPVPVIHFHGTDDTFVPYNGLNGEARKFLTFKSVDDTIRAWAEADGCPKQPKVEKLPDRAHDGTSISRKTYGPGKAGSEVVLWTIQGGGHTWPGRDPVIKFLGKSTRQISANDLLWEFFEKHPLP